MKVNLTEVLRFRERKAGLQQKMLDGALNSAVVSLGMNIPGPVKCSPSIHRAFFEGIKRLEDLLKRQEAQILQKKILEEKAGYAVLYLLVGVDSLKIKRVTILLEEYHKLGRIWDIDVVASDGSAVEREAAGAVRRKCLLCSCDAKECARSRRHSVEKLQSKVTEIIFEWQEGTGRREQCDFEDDK